MGSRVVRARLDGESATGLNVLMREGRTESEALRAALRDAARWRERRSVLAEEAARVAGASGASGARGARQDPVRGTVHRIRTPRGAGQPGQVREVVVAQAEELLGLPTILVVPLSATIRPATFRPTIDLDGRRVQALVEQMGVVPARLLGDVIGRLTPADVRALDDVIELVLGLR